MRSTPKKRGEGNGRIASIGGLDMRALARHALIECVSSCKVWTHTTGWVAHVTCVLGPEPGKLAID